MTVVNQEATAVAVARSAGRIRVDGQPDRRTGPKRTFDYDEAKRRHAAGETYAAIAADLGVTEGAVGRAVNDKTRREMLAYSLAWIANGTCPECGNKATRHSLDKQLRCRACANKAAATTVRDDTLQCSQCREWKPDVLFPRHKSEVHRRRRHAACRECQAAMRQRSRLNRRVPCTSCGELRTHPSDNGGRTNTGLCRPCYFKSRSSATTTENQSSPEVGSS